MTKTSARAVFAARMKQARKAMGISQAQLGVKMGLPEDIASTRINRYEKGVHPPDLETAETLAKALGVSLSYLLAPDDRTAKLLLAFGALTPDRQDKVLAMIDQVAGEKAAKRVAKKVAPDAKKITRRTP